MAIRQVVHIYHRCGFKVQNINVNRQFKHFAYADININITGRNKHSLAI